MPSQLPPRPTRCICSSVLASSVMSQRACLARRDGPLDETAGQALELGARQLQVHVLRPRRVGRDEGERDVGLGGGRQLGLCLFGSLTHTLHGQLVHVEVDALLLLELGGQVVEQRDVEILAAQKRVAVGRLDLEHASRDLEHRHVKRAATQVIHRDDLAVLLVHAVGERRGGGLVDDPEHLQPGDLAGVLGCLPLRVVEVGWHRNNRLTDRPAQVRLGRLLHLLQDEGAGLRRRVALAVDLHPRIPVVGPHHAVRHRRQVLLNVRIVEPAADEPLGREEGALRVGDRLPLGRRADQPFAVVRERHHRRRGARALCVLNHLRAAALHHRHAAVGGAQVDANDSAHRAAAQVSRRAAAEQARAPCHRSRPQPRCELHASRRRCCHRLPRREGLAQELSPVRF
eukprot:scaffold16704_cov112-Isochrysis_galbana.AAC.1